VVGVRSLKLNSYGTLLIGFGRTVNGDTSHRTMEEVPSS